MKIFAIIASIGAGLLILLIAMAPTIAETIAFRQFSPAERAKMKAEYKRWKTEPVQLPEAALKIIPYSEGVKTVARNFEQAWEKDNKRATEFVKAIEEKKGAPKMNDAAATRELAALTPLTNDFTALVRHPDYEIEATASHRVHAKGGMPMPDFLAIQCCAKILKHKVRAEARTGNMEAALRDAETIMRAAVSGPYAMMIGQLIGLAVGDFGITAWSEAVRACSDPAQLRAALEAQNHLSTKLVFFGGGAVNINVMDYVGMIRDAKRRGIDAEFQGLPARALLAKSQEVQGAYMEKFILPAVKSDPNLRLKVQENLEGYRKISASFGGPANGTGSVLVRLGFNLTEPMFYAITAPNFGESFKRGDVMLSKFDLLRLETARKLYKLEKDAAPARDEDLVPTYLPALPQDRFTPKKESLRATGDVKYSIGPDGKDNQNRITYDPSNGTHSAGDIALAR